MKFDVIVNKYLLMWHILFQSSVSQDIHDLKNHIWNENRNEFIALQKEKNIILRDLDNYIPDDDTVYDYIEKQDIYKKFRQETNRYRLMLLEIWDKNKKLYLRELGKILKSDIKGKYTICVVHPSLGVVETNFKDNNIITIGKKFLPKEKDDFLTYLMYKIIKNDLLNIEEQEKAIVSSVVELVATNELYTRVTNESKYGLGKKELRKVKEMIYPYWLMYLGVKPKDMEKYMVRDNIYFNVEAIKYEGQLKNVDILTFIKFLIKNKNQVFSTRQRKIEIIEHL